VAEVAVSGITALGGWGIARVEALGGMASLAWSGLAAGGRQILRGRPRVRECLEQIETCGVSSLGVVLFSVVFTTMMMAVEMSYHVRMVLQQDSLVPAFSTILFTREIGPVVTCLLLASRVGAGMAAEIALMKDTEQLDVLRLLRIDLSDFLLVPRWVGATVSAVGVVLCSLVVSFVASAYLAAPQIGYTPGEYWNSMMLLTHGADLWGAVLKAAVFGSIIALVSVQAGLAAGRGSRGVGGASTSAVVRASVLIIAADLVLTSLLYAV